MSRWTLAFTVSRITSNYGSTIVDYAFLCGGIAHAVLKEKLSSVQEQFSVTKSQVTEGNSRPII